MGILGISPGYPSPTPSHFHPHKIALTLNLAFDLMALLPWQRRNCDNRHVRGSCHSHQTARNGRESATQGGEGGGPSGKGFTVRAACHTDLARSGPRAEQRVETRRDSQVSSTGSSTLYLTVEMTHVERGECLGCPYKTCHIGPAAPTVPPSHRCRLCRTGFLSSVLRRDSTRSVASPSPTTN